MSNQNYHSGINSKFYAGPVTASVEQSLISCSISPSVEIVGFKTSKTGKYTQKEQTFLDCSGSTTLEWDFSSNPFTDAGGGLSLTKGSTFACRLYMNGLSGPFWDFPSCIVTANPQSVAVEGKIQTTINWTVNGPWTEPVT